MRLQILGLFMMACLTIQGQIQYNGFEHFFDFSGDAVPDLMAADWSSMGGQSNPINGQWDTDGIRFENGSFSSDYGQSIPSGSPFGLGTNCAIQIANIYSCTDPLPSLDGNFAKIIPPSNGKMQLLFRYQNAPGVSWNIRAFRWKAFLHNTMNESTEISLKIGTSPDDLFEIDNTSDVGLSLGGIAAFMEFPVSEGFATAVEENDFFYVSFEVEGRDVVYLESGQISQDVPLSSGVCWFLPVGGAASSGNCSLNSNKAPTGHSNLNLQVNMECDDCYEQCLEGIRVTWDYEGSEEHTEFYPTDEYAECIYFWQEGYEALQFNVDHAILFDENICSRTKVKTKIEYEFDNNNCTTNSGGFAYIEPTYYTLPFCHPIQERPTGLFCESSKGKITLKWDEIPGAHHYQIQLFSGTNGFCEPFPGSTHTTTTNSLVIPNNIPACFSARVRAFCSPEQPGPWSLTFGGGLQACQKPPPGDGFPIGFRPSSNDGDDHLSVYPNPSDGVFNIAIAGGNNSPSDLRILDLSGKVVYQTNVPSVSSSITWTPTAELANGVYLVQFSNPEGTYSQRIILQR